MKRILFLLAVLAVVAWCAPAHADEVDDILALKAKNRDRIKSYSAEYVVETELPKDKAGNAKTAKMRYRMWMERLPKEKAKGLLNPWKTEIDVLEPYALSMKVEGERVWLKKGNDWTEQEMTAQMHEQFTGMGERFLGADPAEQRKHFDIRIVRHNSPFFGPRTHTLEYVAKGIVRVFSRMQEDISEGGLPLATRLYDDTGKQTLSAKVTKHHGQDGIPVVDEMESAVQTAGGSMQTRIRCVNVSLAVDGHGGGTESP